MTHQSIKQFPGGATRAWNPGVTAGWHQILDALEQHLTGEQPPDVDYPPLCRFYERVLEELGVARWPNGAALARQIEHAFGRSPPSTCADLSVSGKSFVDFAQRKPTARVRLNGLQAGMERLGIGSGA